VQTDLPQAVLKYSGPSQKVARSAHEPNPGEIIVMVASEEPEPTMVISFNRVFVVDSPLDPITGFTRRAN